MTDLKATWVKLNKDRWECKIADSVLILGVTRRRVSRKYYYSATIQTAGYMLENAMPYETLQLAQARAIETGLRLIVEATNALMYAKHALTE